jgi:hypothetical protein
MSFVLLNMHQMGLVCCPEMKGHPASQASKMAVLSSLGNLVPHTAIISSMGSCREYGRSSENFPFKKPKDAFTKGAKGSTRFEGSRTRPLWGIVVESGERRGLAPWFCQEQ